MSLIIQRLAGGLGNQMFQAASAVSAGLNSGHVVKFHIQNNNGLDRHGFRLREVFGNKFKMATDSEIGTVTGLDPCGWWFKVATHPRYPFCRQGKIVLEQGMGYNDSLVRHDASVYRVGYFQSPLYFSNHAASIKEMFTWSPGFKLPSWSKALQRPGSLAIHVRRGDYVTSNRNRKIFYELSREYYQGAVRFLSRKANVQEIYVFSDDISWAKENLVFDFPTFFTPGKKRWGDYVDMYLMSLCNHHIIANSTFSWWPAWLSEAEDKNVVAPSSWLRSKSRLDIYPAEWEIF